MAGATIGTEVRPGTPIEHDAAIAIGDGIVDRSVRQRAGAESAQRTREALRGLENGVAARTSLIEDPILGLDARTHLIDDLLGVIGCGTVSRLRGL
ncbi:MAG: hypothetical protein ACRDLN_01525 [Solirubrobacteraceae bacterium]